MTTAETEGQQPDLVEQARTSFNQTLFGEYDGSALVNQITHLQLALLESPLPPGKIFAELAVLTRQAADRAGLASDDQTSSLLQQMQKGFELTQKGFEDLGQRPPTIAQPTPTQNLPPMTGVKGGTKPSPETPKTRRGRKPKASQ